MTLTTALSFPVFFPLSIRLHVITAQICRSFDYSWWQILPWPSSMCSEVVPRGCEGQVTHQASEWKCWHWSSNLERWENFKHHHGIFGNKALLLHYVCLECHCRHTSKRCWFWSFSCSFTQQEWKHSQIKLLYKCNWTQREHCCCSSHLLVEECPAPYARKTVTLFFFFLATHVIRLLLVCLDSDAALFFHSCVPLASELCLSTDRYSFLCTVLSLGWCNEFKKTIKEI